MQLYKKSIFRNRSLVKDLLGISLMLVVGIGGLIVVSDPIKTLIPKNPMISPEDWQGSQTKQGLEILGWSEEGRILSVRLTSDNDGGRYYSHISQKAIWYPDMEKTAAQWERSYESDWQLISENFISKDRPASRLSCVDGFSISPYKVFCDFEAYRGHWWTQILFTSYSDEQLSLSEIQQIVAQVNQRLMSVSDEWVMSTQPTSTSLPPVIVLDLDSSTATQPASHSSTPDLSILVTPMMLVPPNNGIIPSCPPLQSGETRVVSPGTFISGNVIIDEVNQYDPNAVDEGVVAYFEKASIVTAPQGAECYMGNSDLINQIIQNELQYGCGSKCASVRFVLVNNDGQHVEIFR